MKVEELTDSILKYTKGYYPDATVIVYVSNPGELAGTDDFAVGVDMFNADHQDVSSAIAFLAQWLADDVEEAQERDT